MTHPQSAPGARADGPPPLEFPVPAQSIVLASAGTGKTYTLSTRLLHTLLERGVGADPAGVLATTFTRKAAREILQRALARLLAAGADADARATLCKETGLALDASTCLAAAASLARRIDRVRIMTLDAMLARMARAAALDLAAAPGWTIADEADLASLDGEAIDLTLRQEGDEQTLPLLRASAKRPYSSRVRASVERYVKECRDAYLGAGADPGAWGVIGPSGQPLGAGELAGAIAAVARAPVPLTSAGRGDARYHKALEKFAEVARSENWEALISDGIGARLLDTGEYYGAAISDGLARALRPIIDHARWHVLDRLRARNLAVAALLERFERHMRATRHARGMLSFDDVPRLLVGADVAGRLGELWYRLDGALDAMLIDEAQDTSLIQFRLLEPLLSELLAGGERQRGVMVVGDVKQSLYAWRNAEAMLLPAIALRWPALAQRSLNRSFRSSPVVLNAVNSVFGAIDENPALQGRAGVSLAATRLRGLFQAHEAAGSASRPPLPGLVRLRTHPIDPEEDSSRPKGDAIRGAVAAVRRLLDDAAATRARPEIGVLVRWNEPIRPLVAALRAAGIDASPEGGSPLATDPVVSALLSLLHLADHPTDTLALFHVVSSPLGGAIGWRGVPGSGRVRRYAARLRRGLCARGYAEVLDRIVRRAGGLMPVESVERVERLLAMARAFDAKASLRPSEFIRVVEQRRVAGGSPAQVRVMTIHASKGLEFDAVVLPDLGRNWSPSGRGAMLLRPDAPDVLGPPVAASLAVARALGVVDPRVRAMLEQREQRDAFEQLCTLYVAMTRAKRALVMLIDPYDDSRRGGDKRAPTAARVLRHALAPGRPVGDADVLLHEASEPARPWCAGLPPATPHAPSAAIPPHDRARAQAIRLAPPSRSSLRRAPVVSPSSLEGDGRTDLGARLAASPGGAADIGTIAHAMLASVRWLDDGPPSRENLIAAAATVRAAQPDSIERALELVSHALRGPIGSALTRAWHHPAGTHELRLEWRFLHPELAPDHQPARVDARRSRDRGAPRTAETRLISGVVDRLVIHRDEGGRPTHADILDFKSDRLAASDEGALGERVEHYRPQMRAYARCIAAMFGLPPGGCRATLLFLATGRIVDVEPA